MGELAGPVAKGRLNRVSVEWNTGVESSRASLHL